jgi:sodium-dependent phosphate transporter
MGSRAFGGGAIVLGLLTYGYHLMRNLGNRLTLMSPSRGFCMELSSAMTILMATRLRLPVSTVRLPPRYLRGSEENANGKKSNNS